MRTILLLTVSNIFMTFAWYGHLKYRSEALWKVFSVLYLGDKFTWNYGVGFGFIVGAAFFTFTSGRLNRLRYLCP